jgi:hypothetical protein
LGDSDELGMMWQEAIMVSFKVLSLHLPGGTEKRHEKCSVRLARVPPHVETGHIPNTCEELLLEQFC